MVSGLNALNSMGVMRFLDCMHTSRVNSNKHSASACASPSSAKSKNSASNKSSTAKSCSVRQKNRGNSPGYPQEAKDKVFNLHVKMCNKEYDIPCNANENMLVALERAGIAGPNRCRGGICGWCRSKLLSGEVFIPENTDGRRDADKVYGYIHPCASFALSDASIEVPNNK